jgi:hypothetical protein
VERLCVEQADWPAERMINHVARIYDQFTLEELSQTVARLVRPQNIPWKGRIDVIYQSVDDLLTAMPEYTGDWYFTGRYPTPGGYRILNTAYLKWRRNDEGRSYEVPNNEKLLIAPAEDSARGAKPHRQRGLRSDSEPKPSTKAMTGFIES